MKVTILFFDSRGGINSSLAVRLAAGWAGETLIAAGMTQESPMAGGVEKMLGGDGAENLQVLVGEEVINKHFDLAIALDAEAAAWLPEIPGNPALIRWQVPAGDPELEEPAEYCRRVEEYLEPKIKELFSGNYIEWLATHKRNQELMLDHLNEGIIVHDAARRITWFNRQAEKLTGYGREEVLGRDCHKVFPGNFCGGKCSFCDGVPGFPSASYSVNINTKSGHPRRVDMSVVALKNDKGEFQGVLASLKDVTEVTHLRKKLKSAENFHGIIGSDEKMHQIFELVRDLAASDCPVLIQGESGTGKELIAGAIHAESGRAGKPFVTVNCGALPEGILESELFGHVKGAFTGAVRDKKGRFELADGGTIFLDEVAELSPTMQVKLLRVLQEGTFDRVGGEKPVRVDVRVLSATNQDLRELMGAGKFREDLFYRLAVVPVTLPPLRSRRNDIPLLVESFIKRFSEDLKREALEVDGRALNALLDYAWPGNIRELQNAIQYAFVKCKEQTLRLEHLPPEVIAQAEVVTAGMSPIHDRAVLAGTGREPKVERIRVEEVTAPRSGRLGWRKLSAQEVQEALTRTGGNKQAAAKLLGVGRATLYRFLRE